MENRLAEELFKYGFICRNTFLSTVLYIDEGHLIHALSTLILLNLWHFYYTTNGIEMPFEMLIKSVLGVQPFSGTCRKLYSRLKG